MEIQEPFVCKYCQSDTHEAVVQAAFWGERGLLVIEDIPARVCRGCGEQFYDEATTEKIEKLIRDPAAKPQRELLVPVFSLAEVEAANGPAGPDE